MSSVDSKAGSFAHALLIVHSEKPAYPFFRDMVEPYLRQLGLAYETVDAATAGGIGEPGRWPLIVLAHPGCLEGGLGLEEEVRAASETGTGIVSLGETFAARGIRPHDGAAASLSSFVSIRTCDHPVTRNHAQGERRRHFNLRRTIRPAVTGCDGGEALARLGSEPLLAASRPEGGEGRTVVWTTMEWLRTGVLGPLYGLDDLVWRSIVWAARKPFAARPLPPFATMRVDDVVGYGRWSGGESPLYWLRECVRLGWKPWLGLFIDDLTSETLDELKPMLANGSATACPHAFSYWDFIYFRHTPLKPEKGYWSEAAVCEPIGPEDVAEHARRVDEWYAAHPDIPMSKVFVPHYYELSSGFLPHLNRWGFEFIGSMNPPNRPYGGAMTFGGPYFAKSLPVAANAPVFYADWFPTGDEAYRNRLFASITEIRDENGYEWAPTRDVDDTIRHGINQLSRALDGNVLAQLFTHESGHIQYIPPDRWMEIIRGVSEYAERRGVLYVTLDEAMRYLRDLHLSRLAGAFLESDGTMAVRLEGACSGTTKVASYADDSLQPEWTEIAPFEDGLAATVGFGAGLRPSGKAERA